MHRRGDTPEREGAGALPGPPHVSYRLRNTAVGPCPTPSSRGPLFPLPELPIAGKGDEGKDLDTSALPHPR